MPDRILQKLPNPLVRPDGTVVKTASEWFSWRPRVEELVVDLEYGGLPPGPEKLDLELADGGIPETYRIITGTGGRQFGFELQLFIPPHDTDAKLPVVLDGDGCWQCMNDKVIDAVNARGFIAARFDRTAVVNDLPTRAEVRESPLYHVFPGIESGTIAGWAWGYHRCVDALLRLPFVDPACIAITGHSRGGKAVLLAGATDERIAFVAPNGSGAGGAGCWRYLMEEPLNKESQRSEVLADLLRSFPQWMGPKMGEYKDHEERLPFDQHYLKALVAPRYFIQTDGLGDTWANPKGAYQTLLAAKEVYNLLGAADKLLSHYRDGGHNHSPEDFAVLLNVMEQAGAGKAQNNDYYANPFPDMQRIFDRD